MAEGASLTMVLMGRTGNGKSATGNSILGEKAFVSKRSSAGVTISSELKTSVRKDGQVINVIDTPGIFDLSQGTEYITREIVKCLDLVKEGIHAVILVFSVKTRFTQEEESTLKTLKKLFGPKIVDYALVVFTGGDEFDDDDDGSSTIDDYLRGCPVALKDILATCKGRYVLFDNKTKSKMKKVEQVNKLLSLVNEVIEQNGGQAFTHTLFLNSKFEEKLEIVQSKFEKEIEAEREARAKVEEKLQEMWKQHGEMQKQNTEDVQKLIKLQLQLAEQQRIHQQEMVQKEHAASEMKQKLEDVENKHQEDVKKLNEKIDDKPDCTIL